MFDNLVNAEPSHVSLYASGHLFLIFSTPNQHVPIVVWVLDDREGLTCYTSVNPHLLSVVMKSKRPSLMN